MVLIVKSYLVLRSKIWQMDISRIERARKLPAPRKLPGPTHSFPW